MLRFLGNIIWIIFGGLISAVVWLVLGLILCVTIVGIPFGVQCFKCAKLTLMPFGKTVDLNVASHLIINTLWVIFVGWWLFLGYVASAIATFITIIGIPFSFQIFKFAKLALFPFGARVD